MTQVKICGIRSLEAALVSIKVGADFLGFNFVSSSKRYIKPGDALRIINQVKGKVKIVGVFQNANLNDVNKIALELGLDFVQLHGVESISYINKVGRPVIKSITLDEQVHEMISPYVLLDRVKQGKGKMVNFAKAAELAAKFSLFYAGGLNPDNVVEVITKVRPFAVDVAKGIEINGEQDIDKIRLFLKNAKGVNI